jgi:hypothetical protein
LGFREASLPLMKPAAFSALSFRTRPGNLLHGLALVALVFLPFSLPLLAETDRGRVWSNTEGVTLHAEFVSQAGDTVTLRRVADGRNFTLSLLQLSLQDREYLQMDGPRIDRIRGVSRPSKPDFIHLRDSAITGNEYALDALNDLTQKLYEGIDPEKNSKRLVENLELMQSLFTPWGMAAGAGNREALDALISATRYSRLRSFVPDALGRGAGQGCERCLEVLLSHQSFNIPSASVVSALVYPAENMNQEAIRFLAAVLTDHQQRPLWQMASNALAIPARKGDPAAKEALQFYEQNK